MASLYEMAQGPNVSLFDSWQAGKDAAFGDKFNKFKLADLQRMDQARPLMGQALMGDQGSLKSLAGLDPNAYMDVAGYQQKQAAAQAEMSDAEKQKIAGAFYSADTPEKWNATIDFLEKQGHQFDPEERDFRNRDAFIGMMQGVKGATQADQFNKGYGLDVLNAETNRINATKRADGQNAPAGYRWTADGNLQAIPGGPRDPSAPAPTRAIRPTTDQNNAAGFYDRMVDAESVLSDQTVVSAAIDYKGKAKASLPFGVGNYLATPEYQRFDQAQRNFINAVLRKESGAAISSSEFENAAIQYFPQPGDTPEKIAQKARNRATTANAMKRTAAGALQQGQPQGQPDAQVYPGADGITGQDIGGGFNAGGVDIPSAAVEDLASDPSPEARAEFDAIFGEGASAQILGQ
jgi:hypothetical protein